MKGSGALASLATDDARKSHAHAHLCSAPYWHCQCFDSRLPTPHEHYYRTGYHHGVCDEFLRIPWRRTASTTWWRRLTNINISVITLQGTILAFVTEFFADFLATDSIDDLVALLKKARLDERLLEFFPPQQRTLDQFNEHFKVLCSSW